jgi:hypothetical protein
MSVIAKANLNLNIDHHTPMEERVYGERVKTLI